VFDIAIVVAFQSVFYLKMYQNNIYILKFIFDTNTSKRFKNTKKLILNKQYFDCDAEHHLNQKHLCNSFFPPLIIISKSGYNKAKVDIINESDVTPFIFHTTYNERK
jgi:hypothetical protein